MTHGPQRPLRLSLTAEGAMYSPSEQYRLLDGARAADQAGADFVDMTEPVLIRALRANKHNPAKGGCLVRG